MRKQWSTEEKAYLTEHFANTSNQVLADHFKVTYSQIVFVASKLGLKKSAAYWSSLMNIELGVKTRFAKGIVPYSAGKKQTEFMSAEAIERCKAGRFKRGNIPKNAAEKDGEIRLRKDGNNKFYKAIRVALGKWVPLYQYNWEQVNGPKPKGMVFWAKDGNSLNYNLDNWELITRQEQVKRNQIHHLPLALKEVIQLRNKLNKKHYEYDQQQRHACAK